MARSRNDPHSHLSSAFSLLEMSIVVVIIALLIGTVTVGMSLQTAAQLRSIMSDASQYAVSMQQFKLKYGALPGDFTDASNVWGASAVGVGDGDGRIYYHTTAGPVYNFEGLLAWKHMSLAGMIMGSYSGTTSLAGVDLVVPGTNAPLSGYAVKSGFSLTSLGNAITGDANLYDGDYDNILVYGASTQFSGPVVAPMEKITDQPALTTADAYEIDRKHDDGVPDTGNIRSYKAGSSNTPSCVAGAPAAYDLGTAGSLCALIFTGSYMDKATR